MSAIPPAPITRLLLARGVVLWMVLRLTFLASNSLALRHPPTLVVAPIVAVAFVALVGGLAVLDLHRRHEALILANVGVSRGAAGVIAALPSVAAELCVALGDALGTAGWVPNG